MVAVRFGDGEGEYHLLLDSAASNTWVMGQECESAACGKHARFGVGDSSSLEVSYYYPLSTNPCPMGRGGLKKKK